MDAILFQFTPPRGGKLVWWADNKVRINISIHAPARGQTSKGLPSRKGKIFQFTPPRGGKRLHRENLPGLQNFNSRPREGANFSTAGKRRGREDISIHAPARGQTRRQRKDQHRKGISIHAPARGQTGMAVTYGGLEDISIHAPARGQTCTPPRKSPGLSISIHAPARGQTGGHPGFGQEDAISIHAPARGQTPASCLHLLVEVYFNSRPREGANRKTSQYLATIHSFNSNNSRKSAVKLHIMSRSRADNAV